MKVSILTPTHNRPHTLQRAIGAVRNQTFSHWEMLIVDDGDGSGYDLAQGCRDPRVKATMNGGKGQVAARNQALSRARGELIALLDDDDWWSDRTHLEMLVAQAAAGPALLHRHGWLVAEDAPQGAAHALFDHETTAQSLRQNNTILTSSLAYPKRFHEQLGAFDEQMGSYFDWDWLLRVLDAGYPLVTINTPGICTSVRADSASATPEREPRRRNFEAFCQKHALQLTIKNHAILHRELSAS